MGCLVGRLSLELDCWPVAGILRLLSGQSWLLKLGLALYFEGLILVFVGSRSDEGLGLEHYSLSGNRSTPIDWRRDLAKLGSAGSRGTYVSW